MSTSITTTSLDATKYFDLATGAAGFLLWLINVQRHFVPFHPYGRAFLDGVEHPPIPPDEDALRPTRVPIRSTPATLTPTSNPQPTNRALADDLDDDSAVTADESAAGPPTAQIKLEPATSADSPSSHQPPNYLYEHNANGIGLTKDGYKAYDAAYRIWQTKQEQGESAINENRWLDAGNIFQEASNLDLNVGLWVREAILKLATCRLRGKDLTAARHAAEHLIRLNDGIAEAHHVLAEVFLLQEEFEMANREANR